MQEPAQPAHRRAIAVGEAVDWASVFEDYGSRVDWPGAAVRQQTMHARPEARLVHTERPE